MTKHVSRTAQLIITALFALDLLAIRYLDNVFVDHRPLRPIGSFVVEHHSHGTSTFITASEHWLYILTWIIPFLLLGTSIILFRLARSDVPTDTESP